MTSPNTATPPGDNTAARTVLITGAAKRIGRALAEDLAGHGWRVAIHYRNSRAEAESLVQSIRASGGQAIALQGDLASAEDVDALVPACTAQLGPPCCLINNASEFSHDTLETLTRDAWHVHLDINLKAPVFLAQAMARHLPQGCEGNVINIIDQRVWDLKPDFFSYTISKAGLWTATRTLAQALAPRIRVNAIAPGPVLRSIHQTEADFAAECATTLMGRGPSLVELADAVRFIISAPAMTGQMIALDGGQHLT